MGIIFDIQKCSVHDGPGIRTTVFLKGCNIRCLWCHNPESFRMHPQVSYERKSCAGCGKCQEICPCDVFQATATGYQLRAENCTGCERCVRVCKTQSLKIFGKEMLAQDVIKEVKKDVKFYHSSGGVTFSGGEPTLQQDFLLDLLKESKAHNIHTCLETNGIIPSAYLEKINTYVDLYLLDYKATGEDLHKSLTGNSGTQILRTLEYLEKQQKKVILRCPIIQGLNNKTEHFSAIREIEEKYDNIIQVELMPYHALGKHKWDILGLDYQLASLSDATAVEKQAWEEQIRQSDS